MTTGHIPDNQEDRKVYLHDHRASSFIQAVGRVSHGADTLAMTVKAFAGEPEVLYVALDYAYHNGVTVTMAPATERESETTVS